MNTKPHLIRILALIMLAAAVSAAAIGASPQTVRIGLTAFGGSNINISADSGLCVGKTGSSDNLLTAQPISIDLEAGSKGITIKFDNKSIDAGASLTITPSDPADTLRVTSENKLTRKYRKTLEINFNARSLRVINIVSLEDYLLGVLPAEMPNSYPAESLKAQAIAARTYALSNLRKHASKGFDLCDCTDCQAYIGVVAEKPNCAKAVRDTCGQVLMFDGKPASILYSNDCGGATRDYAELYPDCNTPYLCAVTEPDDIIHIIWQLAYRFTELEKKLRDAGIKEASGLKSMMVSKTGSTGWVLEIKITGENASTTITSSRLRKILGVSTLKSELFTIETLTSKELLIKGKGWGHGIGLCQVGAKALALPPHNLTYDKILAHYFPGTQISDCSTITTSETAMVPNGGNRRVSRSRPKKNKTPETPKKPFDVRLHVPESP
ncbi:MAG: SpoIID/LytB domain-containing protein [Armatimonadetes bacterium]|nr:SpoIID/LytB domain-containing protein [Armatimonadota bacterium]